MCVCVCERERERDKGKLRWWEEVGEVGGKDRF